MQHRIEISRERKLIGKRLIMSLANNKTGELWKNFIKRIQEVKNTLSNDFISMTIYSPSYFEVFNPTNEFEKWACVEVADFDFIPIDMDTFTINESLYAVFEYKGASNDPGIFQFIIGNWLPNSGYQLDSRPHFEILGKKYINNDPLSEEEIWIPIKPGRKVSH